MVETKTYFVQEKLFVAKEFGPFLFGWINIYIQLKRRSV